MKGKKRRILNFMLSFALMLSLLPIASPPAQASTTYNLWVGGEPVTIEKSRGAGWSYDAASNTLTISNYKNGGAHYAEPISGVYDDSHGYRMAAAIYYAGDDELNIVLEGDNDLSMPSFSENHLDNAAIYTKGDLIISGSGSLTAAGGAAEDKDSDSFVVSYGIYSTGKFTFDGTGTLNSSGGTAGDSYGINAESVEISGGKVSFKGGDTGKNDVYSNGIYCANSLTVSGGEVSATGGKARYSYGFYSEDGGLVVSGGSLKLKGGKASVLSSGFYGYTGGVKVSGGGSLNATGGAVTGEGGSSYGIESFLRSISVEDGSLIARGGSVSGAKGKSLGLYSYFGPIYFREGAKVSVGSGTVKGDGGTSYGIRCMGLDVAGGEAKATGGTADESAGVYIENSMKVESGSLTAKGGGAKKSRGIYNTALNLSVSGGNVIATGGTADESSGIYMAAHEYNDGTVDGGSLSVSGGELKASGGSYGVYCDLRYDGKMIVITDGEAEAAGNVALGKAPILGADVKARGSALIDGSGAADYVEDDNDSYKWFKAQNNAASKKTIRAVEFSVEEPAAGRRPAEKVKISSVPKGAFVIEEYEAKWFVSDDNTTFKPMTSSTFEAEKYYRTELPNEKNAGGPLVALAKAGYLLSPEAVYSVNGEESSMLSLRYLDTFDTLSSSARDGKSAVTGSGSEGASGDASAEDGAVSGGAETGGADSDGGGSDGVVGGYGDGAADEGSDTGGAEGTGSGENTVSERAESGYNAAGETVYYELENDGSFTPVFVVGEPVLGFYDVGWGNWYGASVYYVVERGIFRGTPENTFMPYASASREQVMTVLARFAGVQADSTEEGLSWAVENGISDGLDPKLPVTREQFATMMYRLYAAASIGAIGGEGSPEDSTDDSSTRDLSAQAPTVSSVEMTGAKDSYAQVPSAEMANTEGVSEWAEEAMRFFVAKGYINGMEDGTLNPQGEITRAQMAVIMQRIAQDMDSATGE